MTIRGSVATSAAWLCAALAGCSTPPAAPPMPRVEAAPRGVDAVPSPQAAFEHRQRDRALAFARQRRLADAALAWEVLFVLRPESAEYRERLADLQRQISVAVGERLPRATQALQRGDLEVATQQYLAVLALQPTNEPAANALRAIERERNKRNYLEKYSRTTLTRRAIADAEMPAGRLSGRNDVEHAALLANDGEFDDAIALLEHQLAIDRRDRAARRLLANVYYRKAEFLLPRDPPRGIAALERSVRLDPSEPVAAARLRQLKGSAAMPAAAASSPRRLDARPMP